MHQNSQKRKHFEDTTYFITTVTKDRYSYFENKMLCDLFIEELKLCRELKGFELYAFCILPDHVHLLIKPNETFDISKIMFSLKKQFSHDSNKLTGINDINSTISLATFIPRSLHPQLQRFHPSLQLHNK